ncbi:hypothetical protein PRK78_000774 [Emydomyces testavorans]|uniref:Uncharacterized protein n=1 Tax=Emydomyces testavorans TaxID=2070801 RepID=A0AAF0IES6_9EURO|nr:hypothetical protein PRK78_000774 [Emydomyces testavorans]
MTLDGGAFLISKYSGRSPDFKMQSSQFAGGRTASQKRNAYSRDDDSRERNPPTRSPLRINHKRLDSLFQDVSEGIYRRAEGWGVTRAVRGAVIEARRNIQGVQSSPSTPGLLTKEALVSKLSAPAKLEVAEIRDLSLRILSLENRNKVLASMLGDALQELQAHNAKMEENSKGDSSENIRGALGKIEHVRTLLLNSSLPNTEKPENSSLEQSDTVTTKLPAEGNDETLVAETKQSKSPEPPSSAPLTKKDPGTNDLIKPMPIRPAPRASLAESPFSWMLGEDDRRSAFAPCASVPPEHLRKPEPRTRPALLFGDHRNDDKHKRVEEAENDVLVLDRLQGISKE